MANSETSFNYKAAGWSVGIHVLLLLIFLLFTYSMPIQQPVEELGMEVNLGTSDEGSGTDQPMDVQDPAPPAETGASQPVQANTATTQDMMTSDEPDAPAVTPVQPVTHVQPQRPQPPTTTPRNNTPNQQATVQPTNTPPRQQPRYVYNGATGTGGNRAASNAPGSSEGNTTGNGDRGVPGGTPGASNYTGSPGPGTGGISHTLMGRDITPKRFEAEFTEGGKVVVKVTVDKDGNIVSKSIKSSPSKTLSNLALQKLSQARFSPNKDAAPQQFGEITIVFRTR